jgi:hypothetical protein
MTGIKINRRGRPPRAGVQRYDNGRIVKADQKPEETEEQVLGTVLAYRVKNGAPEALARDQRAGSILGVLRLTEVFSGMQYEAGARLFEVVDRYHAIQGLPRPWATPEPGPTRDDPPEDYTNRVRRSYADAYRAVADLERSASYRGSWKALWGLVMMNDDIRNNARALGNARSGLNVLARLWRMQPT